MNANTMAKGFQRDSEESVDVLVVGEREWERGTRDHRKSVYVTMSLPRRRFLTLTARVWDLEYCTFYIEKTLPTSNY